MLHVERKKSLLPQVLGESRLIIIVTYRTACLLVENILLLRTVLLAPKISQQEEKEGTANNVYGK